MVKLFARVEDFVKAELKKPVINRTIHTAWQAAFGAAVASFSGTHGDVRVALMVGVAAAAAAVKNAVFGKAVVDPTPTASQPPAAS